MKSRIYKLIAGLVAFYALNANALILTPADCVDPICATSDVTSQPNGFDIADYMGVVDSSGNLIDLDLLYLAQVGGADEGIFADSYDTTFSNTATDPTDALVEYVGNLFINCDECFLSIKDGNHSPALYVFDISGWNGTEALDINNFWVDGGAISNIAIWGTVQTDVPEPAPLALLGLGLLGIMLARRKAA